MAENDELAGGLKPRTIPQREEKEDGSTVMTWHLRTAHPCDTHQLAAVAAELSHDTIHLNVDRVEDDAVVVSVKSNREVSHTNVWDFSMRCLLTIDQRLVELIAIEETNRDAWRYRFAVAEHSGTFDADKTPLMIAAEAGDLDRLRIILTTNAVVDIDQSTPFGLTALSYAAKNGHLEAVQLLMNAGARPIARGEVTTLQVGLLGSVEMVGALLAGGSDVNSRNRYGETALMTASALGKLEIVNELLKRGADPRIRDKTSSTAIDRARRYQHPEVLAALQQSG